MNVLVLNTGSSSLKFQVIDTDLEAIEKNADRQLARGVIERIGSESLVTVRVEGPNPGHPFGGRGVGEVPIVPPLAAVANAIAAATGHRFTDLPISPRRIVEELNGLK